MRSAHFTGLPMGELLRSTDDEGFNSEVFDVVYTNGDDFGVIKTPDDVLDVLGEIDTPAEATIYAMANQHKVVCDQVGEATSDEIVVLAQSGGGCSDLVQYELTIGRDGSIDSGDDWVIQDGPDECEELLADGSSGSGGASPGPPPPREDSPTPD